MSLTLVGLHPEPKWVKNVHSTQCGGFPTWEVIKKFPEQQVFPQAYPTSRNINGRALPSPTWSQFFNWQHKVSKTFAISLHHTVPLSFRKISQSKRTRWDMENFHSFSPSLCSIVKAEASPAFRRGPLPPALRHAPPALATPHLQHEPTICEGR